MEIKKEGIMIRKVRALQGRVRAQAEEQGLNANDLVIVKPSINSLPQYEIIKIEGNPVNFLLSMSK